MFEAAADLRVTGHFGEWMQGRLGDDGPLALVTLPCPPLSVWRETDPDAALALPFSRAALDQFRAALDLPDGAWPELGSNIPPGCGAGSSTATLVALARANACGHDPQRVARACLAVEAATDPLMFERPDTLLWASREARVITHLPAPPRAAILAGYWGPSLRTRGDDLAFASISDLVAQWQKACVDGDLNRAAQIASESAARCSDLRGPLEVMTDLATDLGALGWIRAHTGSARGLIFAPGQIPETGAARLIEAGLSGVFQFKTGGT